MASDMIMNIGEALVGDGNEIAHIDLLIGSKTGPVGTAFANALANQSAGHTNLLAVLTPNLIAKPATVLITKVTIKGMKQAVQMFSRRSLAVAKAVADCVANGTIPASQADDLVIVCGVFIHPAAEDDAKIVKIDCRSHEAVHRAHDEESPDAERDHVSEGHSQAPVCRLSDPMASGAQEVLVQLGAEPQPPEHLRRHHLR